MKFNLLLSLLVLLFTISKAVPTISPTTESYHDDIDGNDLSPDVSADFASQAEYTLVCHTGFSASVCVAQYSASCSDNGGFFSHPAENGKSCTSRQCTCSH